MWSTRCSGSPHALADSSHRIRASLTLPPAVLSVARLRRPSTPRTRLPSSRLVPHSLRASPHPPGTLPRLQANVLPPDVFNPLLHETAEAVDSRGSRTDRGFGPPADRPLHPLIEDLGDPHGRAIEPPCPLVSFSGAQVGTSHPGTCGP